MRFNEFLKSFGSRSIIDWNNFNGHIVASAFVYAKFDKKFLLLEHKDLKRFLYPGGHIDIVDKSVLDAAYREVLEGCGLTDLEVVNVCNDKRVPIDIDTHVIDYNERLNLPQHYHFDFRYLFTIEKIVDINIDENELSEYQWVELTKLQDEFNDDNVLKKIEILIKRL